MTVSRNYCDWVLGEFGTHQELQLLVLLSAAVGLLILSQPLRIPYPILLVIGGLLMGFVPGMPELAFRQTSY